MPKIGQQSALRSRPLLGSAGFRRPCPPRKGPSHRIADLHAFALHSPSVRQNLPDLFMRCPWLRRSFDRGRERSPLHLVSAWASEQGLVLGQRRVHETSNEITAIPELLDQLALENSIVTLDAMGCQTAIAEQILGCGADYLLVLKANHPLAYEAVAKHFDQTCFRRGAPQRAACDTFDETHGRLVRRRVFASTKAASLEALSTWPNLHTVLAVEALRSTNGAPKVETEIRYFLSSCRDDPVVLGRAIRQHWAIESAPQAQERKVRDELTDRAQAA